MLIKRYQGNLIIKSDPIFEGLFKLYDIQVYSPDGEFKSGFLTTDNPLHILDHPYSYANLLRLGYAIKDKTDFINALMDYVENVEISDDSDDETELEGYN